VSPEAFRTEHYLLDGIQKVLLPNFVLLATSRQQRGLIDKVLEVRT
jgi:hypothetical protein